MLGEAAVMRSGRNASAARPPERVCMQAFVSMRAIIASDAAIACPTGASGSPTTPRCRRALRRANRAAGRSAPQAAMRRPRATGQARHECALPGGHGRELEQADRQRYESRALPQRRRDPPRELRCRDGLAIAMSHVPSLAAPSTSATMACTRLPTYSKWRRLSIRPSGSGTPRATARQSVRKLPRTRGPYMSGGRRIASDIPEVRAMSVNICSASRLLLA